MTSKIIMMLLVAVVEAVTTTTTTTLMMALQVLSEVALVAEAERVQDRCEVERVPFRVVHLPMSPTLMSGKTCCIGLDWTSIDYYL